MSDSDWLGMSNADHFDSLLMQADLANQEAKPRRTRPALDPNAADPRQPFVAVPIKDCPDCDGKGKPSNWENNEVQFARLLCELVATNETLQLEDVAKSMDLEVDAVNELFDRADAFWEKAKEGLL